VLAFRVSCRRGGVMSLADVVDSSTPTTPAIAGRLGQLQFDQGVLGRSCLTPSITRSTFSLKKETSPAIRGHSITGSG
jgi:hypothetical protein